MAACDRYYRFARLMPIVLMVSDLEDKLARAEEAFLSGELRSAQELLLECVEDPHATDRQRAQALSDLGVIAASENRTREADDLLLAALGHQRSYFPALENMGRRCLTGGDLVQATHWLRSAAEVAPDNADIWRQLAAVLRERRRDAEAAEALSHAGERSPSPVVEVFLGCEPKSGGTAVDRVLIVADLFFPSIGGTERLAEAVGVALQAEGMTVEIAARRLEARVTLVHRGMVIHELEGDASAGLRSVVEAGNYGAVVAFSNARIWPVVATLQLPTPRPRIVVVPCVNAKDSAELRENESYLRAYAQLIGGADVIGYSSRAGYDVRLWEDLGLSGVYIPNAVEMVAVEAPSSTRAIPGDTPLLLVVANLWSAKNHVGLLRNLREHAGDWRLALIGDASPDEPHIALEVARLAAEDPRVHLLGPATPGAVAAAMDDAAMLLLPSLAEATPLVLLEAMSRGLPWIATPTCGAAHDHAGGMILPLGLFGAGIDFLLSRADVSRTLGAVGYEHWRSCYTWDVVGPRYGEIVRGAHVPDLHPPRDVLMVTDKMRSEFYESRVGVRNGLQLRA